jgi:hypothetical protein
MHWNSHVHTLHVCTIDTLRVHHSSYGVLDCVPIGIQKRNGETIMTRMIGKNHPTQYQLLTDSARYAVLNDASLVHVCQDMDVQQINDDLGLTVLEDEFDSFLVAFGDGSYTRVYGCTRRYSVADGLIYTITNPFMIG